MKSVTQLMWEKARDFLQKAFTVIFLGTIVVWFLQTFDFTMHMVEHSDQSMLAYLAGLLTPLFAPLGLDNWKLVTALISGFMAKESVVSMLTILYGSTEALQTSISAASAFTYLVFCLLYTPCIAALIAIWRQSGTKTAVRIFLFQTALAYALSFAFYQTASAACALIR